MSGVLIIDTGVANTASVAAALRRAGAAVTLTADAGAAARTDRLVLPGVGAFRAGMERLRDQGLADVLRDRLDQGRPTLAICLGMQLLCRASEESPGVGGLGVIDADLQRFPDDVRRPQFGWNTVTADEDCSLLQTGAAYFANSYRLVEAPPGWRVARADHGGPFIAALERRGVLACQFHPELSGRWGAGLIDRWLVRAVEAAPC